MVHALLSPHMHSAVRRRHISLNCNKLRTTLQRLERQRVLEHAILQEPAGRAAAAA